MQKQTSLEIKQGALWKATIQIKDGSTVRPIAGYKAYLQARKQPGSPVLIDASTDNGIIVVDDVANTFTITLPASLTRGFDFTRAEYDMFVVPPGSDPALLLFGSVSVFKAITVI